MASINTNMPDATSADLAALRDAQRKYDQARARASERLDDASIANYRTAARELQTLERRLENGRRALR
jgi:hypothetical protein